MPFNLRGGRPKNMGQGTYWVQKHRDDQRRNALGAVSNQMVHRFNERYSRITSQFLPIFQGYAGPEGTIEVIPGSKLDQSLDRYNELKVWLDANIDQATHYDLSKLATSAKNILLEIAKREGWPTAWNTSSKQLSFRGRTLDFS